MIFFLCSLEYFSDVRSNSTPRPPLEIFDCLTRVTVCGDFVSCWWFIFAINLILYFSSYLFFVRVVCATLSFFWMAVLLLQETMWVFCCTKRWFQCSCVLRDIIFYIFLSSYFKVSFFNEVYLSLFILISVCNGGGYWINYLATNQVPSSIVHLTSLWHFRIKAAAFTWHCVKLVRVERDWVSAMYTRCFRWVWP